MRTKFTGLIITLSLAIVVTFSWKAAAEEVPRITKEEVKEMLDDSETIIIDVRAGHAWDLSELKIRGAVRGDPRDLNSWADKYPKYKTLVFY